MSGLLFLCIAAIVSASGNGNRNGNGAGSDSRANLNSTGNGNGNGSSDSSSSSGSSDSGSSSDSGTLGANSNGSAATAVTPAASVDSAADRPHDPSTTHLRKEARLALSDKPVPVDLSGSWRCRLGDDRAWAQPKTDDHTWTTAQLPELTDEQGTPVFEEQKPVWCRLSVFLPGTLEQGLALRLGAVRGAVEVYLNGSWVGGRGRTEAGNGTLEDRLGDTVYTLPAGLWQAKAQNTLALRLRRPEPELPPLAAPLELGPERAMRTAAAWTNLWRVTMPGLTGIVLLVLGLAHAVFFFVGARGRGHLALALAELGAGLPLGERLLPLGDSLGGTPALARLAPVATVAAALGFAFWCEQAFRQMVGRWQPWAVGGAILLGLVAALTPRTSGLAFVAEAASGAAILLALGFAGTIATQALIEGQRRGAVVLALMLPVTLAAGYDLWSRFAGAPSIVLLPFAAAAGLVGVTFVALGDEVRERSRFEAQVGALQLELRDLSSIHRFGTGINSVLDLPGFLNEVVQETAHQLGVRRCSLIFADGPTEMRIKASVGLPRELADKPLPTGSGIAGWVFRHGEPLTPARLATLTFDKPDLESARYLTTSFVSWPLKHEGTIIGVLNATDRNDGGPLAATDEALVEAVANRLAQVVGNALYYQRLREENERMRAAVGSTPQT